MIASDSELLLLVDGMKRPDPRRGGKVPHETRRGQSPQTEVDGNRGTVERMAKTSS
jgi:hypothetical protein